MRWWIAGIPLDRGAGKKRTGTLTVWSPFAQNIVINVFADGTQRVARTLAPKVANALLLRGGVSTTVEVVCAQDCIAAVTVWDGNDPLLAMPGLACREEFE